MAQNHPAGWSARQEPGESRVVGSTGVGAGQTSPGWVLNLEPQWLCLNPPLPRQPPSETIVGTISKPPLLPGHSCSPDTALHVSPGSS